VSPAVSVVVCIYNVERYLRDCLDSIAGQSFADFECILCDDDSTDASGLIAQNFAESDSRFLYVHQKNRGPGPAGGRNGGIPWITGDRIMFVDSDDVLLPDALEVLYRSAESTGSELVIGGVDRFNSSGRWPSFLHQRVHVGERPATNIEEFPEMVWDSTAWNKLIATSLWNEHIKFFDEGRLYEDLYPMIRLMCLANSVDILDDTIYLWRDRESKTSVTQQVASTRGLVDKVDQMLKLDAFFVATNNHVAKQAQDHKLLSADLLWMLDDLDRGDQAFHDAFWSDVPTLVNAMDRGVLERLPASLRGQYDLVSARDRAGLSKFRRESAGVGFSPHTIRRVFSTDEARSADGESHLTELFGRTTGVMAVGSDVVVNGYVALDRVRLRNGHGKLAVWFESWETGHRVEVDVELQLRPRLHLTRQGPQLHRYTGFRARVQASDLVAEDVPVGNVMVGATLEATTGQAGSGRLSMDRRYEWTHPEGAGAVSVRSYTDHLDNLSLKIAEPMSATEILTQESTMHVGFADPVESRISLFDPVLERRWMAASTPGPTTSVSFDLVGLPTGEYLLETLRESRAFEDGWVPIAGPSIDTPTAQVGDRVVRLHLSRALTKLEIVDSRSELRDLKPSFRSSLDVTFTELARQINKYTWI